VPPSPPARETEHQSCSERDAEADRDRPHRYGGRNRGKADKSRGGRLTLAFTESGSACTRPAWRFESLERRKEPRSRGSFRYFRSALPFPTLHQLGRLKRRSADKGQRLDRVASPTRKTRERSRVVVSEPRPAAPVEISSAGTQSAGETSSDQIKSRVWPSAKRRATTSWHLRL
jgi:hypothetical protein